MPLHPPSPKKTRQTLHIRHPPETTQQRNDVTLIATTRALARITTWVVGQKLEGRPELIRDALQKLANYSD